MTDRVASDPCVSVWTSTLDALPPAAAGEAAAALEELGFRGLWFGEAYGREAFTAAALLLAATTTLRVATGIANIYARDAVAANAAGRTLAAAYPDRFVLGLGVSHQPLVERTRGHEYRAPLATMRAYLDAMDAAPYLADSSGAPPLRVLAALGPRMLALAAERADGAHPYLGTPEHTATARAVLGADRWLAVEQAVVLDDDEEVWAARAREHLTIYTGLPNYRAHWSRLGFAEPDYLRGGSPRLQQALVTRGLDAARARVAEHLAAGADEVCVQVLGADPFAPPVAEWARLAPAVLDLRRG